MLKRILVADDRRSARRMVVMVLNRVGLYSVTEVENGAAALVEFNQALKEKCPFDLVISDLEMPRLGGDDLYLEIKSRLGDCRFVLMSNSLGIRQIAKGLKVDWFDKEHTEEGVKEATSKLTTTRPPGTTK